MNILILTQIVDIDDTTLGFFHSWIIEFSKHCQRVTVICLKEGKHTLPSNVKILSLGKEKGSSRLKYLWNFYRYVWWERKNYDTVFIHMNQEYVLLAGLWWRLLGKKVLLWRNHPKGNWLTSLAVFISNRVFCTSDQSYTVKFKKTFVMPAGINLEKFMISDAPERMTNSILCIGRISPVKHIEVFIDALIILDKENINFNASIVGDKDPSSEEYYQEICDMSKPLVDKGKLSVLPAVPNSKTPQLYYSYEVIVNMTDSGSYDKTILSAMISGAIVILSNLSFKGVLQDKFVFKECDANDLVLKIKGVFAMTVEEKSEAVEFNKKYVRDEHGLAKTISEILKS